MVLKGLNWLGGGVLGAVELTEGVRIKGLFLVEPPLLLLGVPGR